MEGDTIKSHYHKKLYLHMKIIVQYRISSYIYDRVTRVTESMLKEQTKVIVILNMGLV